MVVGGGEDNPLPQIADRVAADAAINGLTAWGYSLLRQLGRPIKSEWLKESSKEWFNKELPQPWVPPKEEFLKYVEPFAGQSTYGTSRGINQLRHKYGLDVDSTWKGREYVLEEDPAKRTSPANAALYDSQGRALPGTPAQTPSLRAQAEEAAREEARKLAADRAAFDALNTIQTIDEENPPPGMTRAQARRRNRELDAEQLSNFEARYGSSLQGPATPTTLPGSPTAPFAPAGVAVGEPSPTTIPTTPTSTPGVPATAANNFLPPYLQPGGTATTSGQPPSPFNPVTPPSTFGTPPLPAVNQMAPIVPLGIAPQGSPFTPFVPNAPMANRGMGGGNSFESTAKLLQLPYYLRNLYGR